MLSSILTRSTKQCPVSSVVELRFYTARVGSSNLSPGTKFLTRHFTDKEVWSAVFNRLVPSLIKGNDMYTEGSGYANVV